MQKKNHLLKILKKSYRKKKNMAISTPNHSMGKVKLPKKSKKTTKSKKK